MAKEYGRSVRLETNMDAYRGLFSDDWGVRVTDFADGKSKLDPIVFDLLMEWRAAAYTASLPLAIIDHMKGYHDGLFEKREFSTTLLRVASAVIGKLEHSIPELTSDSGMIRKLRERIVVLGAEFEEARDKAQFEFPVAETWRDYLDNNVYQLSLWGSQRTCYVSVYNSFDSFAFRCVRCVRDLQNQQTSRTSQESFKDEFKATFGVDLKGACWTSSDVTLARAVRNSLTHANGTITRELAPRRDLKILVQDDLLHVMPDDTKHLYSVLSKAALTLVEKASTMPDFA